jgi:hypothetical protein
VDKGVVADWRIATLDCVDRLKLPEQHSRFIAATLHNFFEPLISTKASKLQKDELWEKMIDVCQKSVELKMKMQRSKEGYSVHTFDVKEHPIASRVESFADPMGVEGGPSTDASDEILYVLFGGLTKYANQFGEEKKTLVKAEVILKKRK